MFALAIRYLNGWTMAAADGARKQKPEWPPHPDRVFMALAAAHFETDGDGAERVALEWLEALSAPAMAASEAAERRIVTGFVPVNDSSDPLYVKYEKKVRVEKPYQVAGSFSVGRNRQPRSFPVAIPRDPTVYLLWPDTEAKEHGPVLNALCRKVTYVGHSASFVQMWLDDTPPPATWLPTEGPAERRLRISGAGRLFDLERRFNRVACLEYADFASHIEKASKKERKAFQDEQRRLFPSGMPVSRRPEPGLWQGYSRPQPVATPDVCGSVFDHRLVMLSLSGQRPGLRATQKLVAAMRGALLASCPSPVPEWVSGHQPDGRPTRHPHLAILPLPFVGTHHADGRIMGVALALPADLSPEETGHVFTSWLTDENGLPRRIRLFGGEWLECVAMLEEREAPPLNLRHESWIGPARRWTTVTPVVLDRHHDGRGRWDKAAETVKDACERIGLPRPSGVVLHPVSRITGVPRANEFAPLMRKQGGRLQHLHAVILFDHEVRGPVVVGAGRFRGYGLCRPDDPKGGFADA